MMSTLVLKMVSIFDPNLNINVSDASLFPSKSIQINKRLVFIVHHFNPLATVHHQILSPILLLESKVFQLISEKKINLKHVSNN